MHAYRYTQHVCGATDGLRRHGHRSHSRSPAYPIDRNTLMNLDYDDYVQQVSRGLHPTIYPGMAGASAIGSSSINVYQPSLPTQENDLKYEERVNAFLRGIGSGGGGAHSRHSRSRHARRGSPPGGHSDGRRRRSYSYSRSQSRSSYSASSSYSYSPRDGVSRSGPIHHPAPAPPPHCNHTDWCHRPKCSRSRSPSPNRRGSGRQQNRHNRGPPPADLLARGRHHATTHDRRQQPRSGSPRPGSLHASRRRRHSSVSSGDDGGRSLSPAPKQAGDYWHQSQRTSAAVGMSSRSRVVGALPPLDASRRNPDDEVLSGHCSGSSRRMYSQTTARRHR